MAEHLGASSRSPRHPFPALMAGVNPAMCLCTGPTSAVQLTSLHGDRDIQSVDGLRDVIGRGVCCCTQRTCNNRSRFHQAATVGARLSPPRQTLEDAGPDQPTSITLSVYCNWRISMETEQDHGNLPVRHDRISTTNEGLQLRRLHSLQS